VNTQVVLLDAYGTSSDETLLDQYLRVRQHTQTLVAPLNHEDMAVQERLVRGQHLDQR
jgi:hypothetical protein